MRLGFRDEVLVTELLWGAHCRQKQCWGFFGKIQLSIICGLKTGIFI